MRLFIAVSVDAVVGRLSEVVADLRSSNADCKWVSPENLHLTMQFLGETPEDKVEAIAAAMREACAGRRRFELSFGSLGAFPSAGNPRVIWIGLGEGAQRLEELANALARGLAGQGIVLPEEGREFKAHLTIGRVRGPRDLQRLRARMQAWTPEKLALGRVAVDKLSLIQSRLTPKGPIYTAIKTAELAP